MSVSRADLVFPPALRQLLPSPSSPLLLLHCFLFPFPIQRVREVVGASGHSLPIYHLIRPPKSSLLTGWHWKSQGFLSSDVTRNCDAFEAQSGLEPVGLCCVQCSIGVRKSLPGARLLPLKWIPRICTHQTGISFALSHLVSEIQHSLITEWFKEPPHEEGVVSLELDTAGKSQCYFCNQHLE